jgi:exodeoxyribonuclease VII small subunit
MAKQTFEEAMEKLEEIVRELETGQLPLDAAMKRFEEGMRLSRFCSQRLDETEKKITLLMQDHDMNPVEKPFEDEEAG